MDRTLQQDLDLLVSCVRSRRETGATAVAAGLKQQLKRNSGGSFDESDHGYASFKEFLERAEADGLIRLERGPSDILVMLPDEDDAWQTSRRVRADLWSAFVDWNVDSRRFFDTETGLAYFVDGPDASATPQDVVARYRQNPDAFIEIAPISRDVQLGWMREFAQGQDAHIAQFLLGALDNDRPAWAFARAIRSSGGTTQADWNKALAERVRAAVEEWLDGHQLSSDVGAAPKSERPKDEVEFLRRHIHSAIDRLSAEELRRVQLPAGEWLAGLERD